MHQILVSAYGCEPNKGSEQGVGWHWVLEMAKTEELWVVTRSNNKDAIESTIPASFAGRIHFIYYDLPKVVKRFKRNEKGLYLYYALWQWGAYKKAKQLSKEITFDYCMHLSFGSMWMPTFMYKLPIPFIWGPIGGGERVPCCYINTLPWASRIPQYARKILIRTAALNPLIALPAKKARAIIARTKESQAVFPKKYQEKIQVMLETGMASEILDKYKSTKPEKSSSCIELIYTGRLVGSKNVKMAILALASLKQTGQQLRLTIVGDGPLRASLTTLAKVHGVLDHISFAGTVTQQEAIHSLKQADIFLFPSLREGGSWSLIEAMAVGLPIVCLDTSGMHVITDEMCAIRILPTTPEENIRNMGEAILKLAKSADLRRDMGEHARKRIQEHFLWPNKGSFIVDLLNKLDLQKPNLGSR
jgi:glycosyltransferase involved in cell wall biosynthesis